MARKRVGPRGGPRGDGGRTDPGPPWTDRARAVVAGAARQAGRRREAAVLPEHLLLELARTAGAGPAVLSDLGVDLEVLAAGVEATLPPIVAADALAGPYRHAPALVEVLVRAAAAARELGQEYVGTEHLLLGLLGAATGAAKAGAGGELLRAGASPEAVWAEVARRFGRGPGGHVAPGDPRRSSAPAATSAGGVAPSPFEIALDGESRLPAYRQIMGQVKEAVAARRLRAGDRLPSVRAAARRLGVAPGTVGRAYAELERAGLLVTRRARGTRVAGRSARIPRPDADSAALVALLRPVAIEAFHLGVNAGQLEAALREAMREIYPTGRPDR